MKTHYYLLVLYFFIGFRVCVNGQRKSIITNRIYSGIIGTDTIKLHLKEQGSNITGYFYYEKDGEPIEFSGNQRRSKKKIDLLINTSLGEATLKLKRNSSGFKGTWKNIDGTSNVSIRFTGLEYKSESYIVTDSFLLGADVKNAPFYDFRITSDWPTENDPAHDFIRREIVNMLDPDNYTNDAGMPYILDTIKNFYKNDYLSLKEGLTEEETENILTSALLNWSLNSKTTVEIISDNLATIQLINTTYTGGAHGAHQESIRNLNLSEKSALEIYDVFTEDGLIILPTLIDKRFRSVYKIDANVSLGDWGIFGAQIETTSEQFQLHKKGISFIYNEYEIAPYSTGTINIFLPYPSIEEYLQPSFKKLLNKN